MQRGSFDISSEGTSPRSQASVTDEDSDRPQPSAPAAAAAAAGTHRSSRRSGSSGRQAATAAQQQLERRLQDKESASEPTHHSPSPAQLLQQRRPSQHRSLCRSVALCSVVELQSRVRHLEQAATLTQAQVAAERSEQNNRIQQLQDELDKARRAAEQKVGHHLPIIQSALRTHLCSLLTPVSVLSLCCAASRRVRRPTGRASCSN